MTARLARWILPAALLAATAAPQAAGAATPAQTQTHDNCFLSRDWDGWSAPGESNRLLLRVAVRDVYEVELTPGTKVRDDGFNILVTRTRGSSWLCTPMDLDLVLTDRTTGMRIPLIARSMRKLTPQEIAAIPKKDLP